MVPYDAGDHFEQIFLLYFDAGGRSLLIGDRLENCWLATSNSCINKKNCEKMPKLLVYLLGSTIFLLYETYSFILMHVTCTFLFGCQKILC